MRLSVLEKRSVVATDCTVVSGVVNRLGGGRDRGLGGGIDRGADRRVGGGADGLVRSSPGGRVDGGVLRGGGAGHRCGRVSDRRLPADCLPQPFARGSACRPGKTKWPTSIAEARPAKAAWPGPSEPPPAAASSLARAWAARAVSVTTHRVTGIKPSALRACSRIVPAASARGKVPLDQPRAVALDPGLRRRLPPPAGHAGQGVIQQRVTGRGGGTDHDTAAHDTHRSRHPRGIQVGIVSAETFKPLPGITALGGVAR